MALWSLTMERVEKLKKDKDEKFKELEILKAKSESQIWLNDLDEFEKEYKKIRNSFSSNNTKS